MSTFHVIGIIAFVTIGLYLGSIGYLMGYLRRVHPDLWVNLGEPTLPWTFSKNRTLANPLGAPPDGGLGMLRFVFSKQYKSVDDSKLANLIWVVRASIIASMVIMIILFAH